MHKVNRSLLVLTFMAVGGMASFVGKGLWSGRAQQSRQPQMSRDDSVAYRTGIRKGEYLDGNFLPVTQVLLKEGEPLFLRNCSVCHGSAGLGNGPAAGTLPVHPPSYRGANAMQLTDGEIFATISGGKGIMPAFGGILEPGDRWAVVGYVRKLQKGRNDP